MFHSIGTPSGKLAVMNTWKASMAPKIANVPGPPSVTSSATGMPASTTAPACAITMASRDGCMSSGNDLNMARRTAGKKCVSGLVACITDTTSGKCGVSLDTAAQNQMAIQVHFMPATQSSANSRQTAAVRKCSARADRKMVVSTTPHTSSSTTSGTMCTAVSVSAGATRA